MKQNKFFFKILAPIIILIASGAFFYQMLKTKPAPKITAAKEHIWNVQSTSALINDYQPAIRLYAKIMSNLDIKLSSSIDADVSQRFVRVGEKISKNQALLRLDSTQIQQILQQRKAEVDEIHADISDEKQRYLTDEKLLKQEQKILVIAENAVKRAKTLEKSEMASSSQLDDANKSALQQQLAIAQRESSIANHPNRLAKLAARLSKAKARLFIAKTDLEKTDIRSPVNGYVRSIDVNLAEHVRPGNPLINVFDSENLEVRTLVPEYYIRTFQQSIAQNNPIKGFAEINNQQVTIELDRIAGNIKPGHAGSYAYFQLLAPKNIVNIGQLVELQVELNPVKNSILLPSAALYGTDSVFKIVDGRLQRIKVTWFGNTINYASNITPYNDNIKTSIIVQSADINNDDVILSSKFANAMQGLKVSITNIDKRKIDKNQPDTENSINLDDSSN